VFHLDPVYRLSSKVIVRGHGMINVPFSATDAVDRLKSEREVGKPVTGKCRW